MPALFALEGSCMDDLDPGNVATIALVVHGVGDHSHRLIMSEGRDGVLAMGDPDVHIDEVKIPGMYDDVNPDELRSAFQINAGGRVHLFVPVVWSRLRPRSANEAQLPPQWGFTALVDRLFLACVFLLMSSVNTFRCIPATRGRARKSLVTMVAVLYAVLAPGFAAGLFYLISYLATLRVSSDQADFHWWRGPAFIIFIALLGWPVTKILMVFDFVGDVMGYVGNRRHREKAEQRLLGIIRDCGNRFPKARLVVVGHSLGSVLVTHTVLLPEARALGDRLHLVTMGSPLRRMSSFFPSRIKSPEQLVGEYERHQIVPSWANLWRDADGIGQRLGPSSSGRFGEKSLGNGVHANYWSDGRCWRAVIDYLRALSDGSWARVINDWNSQALSPPENDELILHRHQIVQLVLWLGSLLVSSNILLWNTLRSGGFLHGTTMWYRWTTLTMAGMSALSFIGYFVVLTMPLLRTAAAPRDQLGRYRASRRFADMMFKCGFLLGMATAIAGASA